MKKPNITEGDWEVSDNGMWHSDGECYIGVDSGDDDGYGFIVFDKLDYSSDESKANAKAISAVPNMVNDLIKDYTRNNEKESI